MAWSEDDGTRCFTMGPDDADRVEVPVEHLDPIVDNIAHFAQCVRSRSRPETGGPEGLAVVEIMEAMDLSAREHGAPIDPRVL